MPEALDDIRVIDNRLFRALCRRLGGLLGLSEHEIDRIQAEGVI